MWCNQIFSLLSLTNDASYVIENMIVCDNQVVAESIATSNYGPNAIAIDTTRYPVGIGNTYKNGIFYNENNEEIIPNPTEEERIKQLNATIFKLSSIQADILYEMDCNELGIDDEE